MKAIHGGKAKNDKIDAHKTATLLRGGACKHGKAKGLSILAARLGRSVYFMLKNQEAFDMDRFFA